MVGVAGGGVVSRVRAEAGAVAVAGEESAQEIPGPRGKLAPHLLRVCVKWRSSFSSRAGRPSGGSRERERSERNRTPQTGTGSITSNAGWSCFYSTLSSITKVHHRLIGGTIRACPYPTRVNDHSRSSMYTANAYQWPLAFSRPKHTHNLCVGP